MARGASAARRGAAGAPRARGEAADAFRLSWPVAFLVVAAAVVVVFGRTVANGFVHWDDGDNIFANPLLDPPTWSGVRFLWTNPYHELYIPMIYTSFVVDVLIGGGKPWVFHLGNVILHALSSMAVLQILRRLLRPQGTAGTAACMAGALVFAIHPLQTEAVAWATGRKDVMCGLFCLLAVWQYIEFRLADGAGRRTAAYGVALCCFVLALLSKPAAVAVPLALAAIDLLALRLSIVRTLRGVGAWFLLSGVFTWITMGVQQLSPEFLSKLPPAWTRPFVASDALLFYLWKMVWPAGLTAVYGRTPAAVMATPWPYLALPVAGVTLGWLLLRRGTAAAAAGLYVAFLFPVLGLMPFGYQSYSTVADRYVYLSMLGVALGVACLVTWLASARGQRLSSVMGVAGIWLAVLGMLAFRQAGFWKDSEALWGRSLVVASQVEVAHTNLATLYMQTKREQLAREHYAKAVELAPGSSIAQFGCGLVMLRAGRPADAEPHFRKALEANPKYADAYATLGDALVRMGRLDEAVDCYVKAVDIKPAHLQARVNLAATFVDLKQYPDAERELRAAIALNPKRVVAQVNLAAVLVLQGRRDEAAGVYRQVLLLDPSNRDARAFLGNAGPGF